jgi:hypothetical protein
MSIWPRLLLALSSLHAALVSLTVGIVFIYIKNCRYCLFFMLHLYSLTSIVFSSCICRSYCWHCHLFMLALSSLTGWRCLLLMLHLSSLTVGMSFATAVLPVLFVCLSCPKGCTSPHLLMQLPCPLLLDLLLIRPSFFLLHQSHHSSLIEAIVVVIVLA